MTFKNLNKVIKSKISKIYNIPTNTDSVLVDSNNIPYILYGKSKVILSINVNSFFDGGFHTGSIKTNF